MSKPWFLKIAMEAEPSPLAGTIAQVLGKKETTEIVSIHKEASVNPLENVVTGLPSPTFATL